MEDLVKLHLADCRSHGRLGVYADGIERGPGPVTSALRVLELHVEISAYVHTNVVLKEGRGGGGEGVMRWGGGGQ